MELWVHTALGVLFCNAAQEGKLALFHALEEASRIAPEMDAQGIVSRPESQTHPGTSISPSGVLTRVTSALSTTRPATHTKERGGMSGNDEMGVTGWCTK